MTRTNQLWFCSKLAGLAEVSGVTLLNRFRDAENWLRQLCELLLREQGVHLHPKLPARPVGWLDGTAVSEPGMTGSRWRIHYSLRLPALECDDFVLASTRGKGASERFGQFRFQPGDLVLADAGYGNPPGALAAVEQGAIFAFASIRTPLPLYDEAGGRFGLRAAPGGLETAGEVAERPVRDQAGQRVLCGRLPFATAARPSRGPKGA